MKMSSFWLVTQVPMARASILWLMGEYCERVPKIAPDVLRKMAKTFTAEEDIVKLQTVNLAAKLYLTNSKQVTWLWVNDTLRATVLRLQLFKSITFLFLYVSLFLQTKLLTQYILNLGKYDPNYDIRDRTRFIRQLIVPSEKSGALNKYARRILLAPKPAPVLESAFKGTSCQICEIKLLTIFWNRLNLLGRFDCLRLNTIPLLCLVLQLNLWIRAENLYSTYCGSVSSNMQSRSR